MSRRRLASRQEGGSQDHGSGKAGGKTASPFAALRRQLQQTVATAQPADARGAGRKRIRHPIEEASPASGDGHAQQPDAADLALFRSSVGAVCPVRTGDRIEVDKPRPPPQPRAHDLADDTREDPRLRGGGTTDPLRAAYEGVVPLRDSGRVALETPLHHRTRRPDAGHASSALRPDAIVLPADTDVSDPAVLFRTVIGNTRPVADRNRAELERPLPSPTPIKREADERAALQESLAAPLTFEDRLDMGDEAAFLRTGLPRRVLTDLRRGRWVLQGQIDLHGLTRDEARAALAVFLHDALAQGKRCIRVIHGKGHGSPGKVSILKQLSRGWLAQREEILAFCQAGPHDGGGGALLVLLRAHNAAPRS
ncbi:Smr/MutS family protein [Thauera sp.]|uniref:Smr/MutS family protein n=1 Tax=Thauera sp. TaxID=1905334 RepID=UPI00261CE76F|nr:Smr/MutS family protein [Thauera sp.]